ncbi:MAG: alpha/beta hydrolase [Gammaproteobacteria bacterium]|nr:alpha/beta hydrolase [Gammaproteobacteria bacterium]
MRFPLAILLVLFGCVGCAGVPPVTPVLPQPVDGAAITIESPQAGRVVMFEALPATGDAHRPLLLIHSVNAAGSAYEVRPLYEHARGTRPVYAIDLPGFGFSERSDRVYTPRLMTDGVLAAVAEIRRRHGGVAIDALGLSLSSEFLARAAAEQPDAFAHVALVSPTGFSGKKQRHGAPGSTRGQAWLYRTLSWSAWDDGIYGLLTRPGTIRYFLERTWGSKAIDEGLWAYDVITTQQPGAKHAPLHFVSANLFAADVNTLYDRLTMPVWMSHGIRGDFVDYRGQAWYADRPNWSFTEFPTGALPQFEVTADFCAALDRFLADTRP